MRALALCLALILAPAPSARACEIALALAVDVSGSVDPGEYRIQMEGLAAALRDSQISEALVRAEAAVTLVQWTGSTRQAVSVPWVRVTGFDDVEMLAERIAGTARAWRMFSTAIGEALTFSAQQFAAVPDCKRRVIDVSGDGVSNEGPEPETQRDFLAAVGVTVNALVIEGPTPGLTEYFRENVITGPGAFAVRADGFVEYPDRIRRKLLREVSEQISMADPAPPQADNL